MCPPTEEESEDRRLGGREEEEANGGGRGGPPTPPPIESEGEVAPTAATMTETTTETTMMKSGGDGGRDGPSVAGEAESDDVARDDSEASRPEPEAPEAPPEESDDDSRPDGGAAPAAALPPRLLRGPTPRPRSEWTVRTSPQDSSFLPTLGVTLWLGWNGFLVYVLVYAAAFAGTTGRAVVAGLCGLSLALPRDVWMEASGEGGRTGVGRRFGDWCMLMAERYFGLTTVLEDEPSLLRISHSSTKAAVFAFEPHDVLPYPIFAFSPALGRLPGRIGSQNSGLMSSAVFRAPFLRQVYTWASANPVDRTTFRRRLERGESFTFVPGGVQEVTSMDPSDPDGDVMLYLKRRRGFVRLALASGSPVVPVFCFGVDGSYGYWIPKGRTALALGRRIGFLPMVFWGRFGIPFGIPRPRRLTVVAGSPIDLPELGEGGATEEEVGRYHELFLGEMEGLYERHRVDAGYGNRRLRII